MRERLLSLTEYSDDVERLQPYRAKLMQQEENKSHILVQNINHIVTKNYGPSFMLQEIAKLLVVSSQADLCLISTTKNDQCSQIFTETWNKSQSLPREEYDQLLSVHEFLVNSLSIIKSVNQILTGEDIVRYEKNITLNNYCLSVSLKYVLVIPTKMNDKTNGVITLIRFAENEWNESDKKLLKEVEPSCAIALEQITQQQILAENQEFLYKASQHQNLIKQLSTLSLSNLELNQMLQVIISSTAESLEVDRGLLILLKYTNPMFRNRHKKQIPKAKATVLGAWNKSKNVSKRYLDVMDKFFWMSECGLCQRVFLESDNLIIMDKDTVQRQKLKANLLFATQYFTNTLLVPIENQGKVLGFVVLQQQKTRNWQASELNLVEMVCTQVSNAIMQSQTIRQVQNLVDERTEQLRRSLEVQAKLYERTKQYVAQLQELNELKDEFVSNLSDRLRYPLTNMRMSIRNLRLPGITQERQARYLDILESECTKEINLINDLLTLQKLESDQEEPQLETIDVNNKINQLLSEVKQPLQNQGLSVEVDLPKQPLSLQTEIESFDRILQELFNNICKYSERDSTVSLQATHRVEQEIDQVIIKVTNIGRGISPEEAAYIFDKFRRGKGRWTPGTGLGLALVKSLVQHLHGEIFVESTPIADSQLSEICFTLTLPQFSTVNNPNLQP